MWREQRETPISQSSPGRGIIACLKSYCLGFGQIAYDGNNYLVLNEDLCFWTTVDTAAQTSKLKLEQGGAAGHSRNYLDGDCRGWLHRHLENRKDTLLSAGMRGAGPP